MPAYSFENTIELKRKIVIVAVILAAVVIAVSYKFLMGFYSPGSANADSPDFEIINKHFDTSARASLGVAYVSATVRNKGEAGTMKICARFTQYETHSVQIKNLYLKSGESQEVTFEFELFGAIASWTRWMSYDVWVES